LHRANWKTCSITLWPCLRITGFANVANLYQGSKVLTKTAALRPVAVAAGFLFTFHVPADEVIINNGDRLTGSVKATREYKLILETSYAGEIKVQLSNIQRIVTDKPVRIILDVHSQVTGVLSASDRTEMMIRGTGGVKHQPVTMARISSINPTEISTVQVTGQFNAELDSEIGLRTPISSARPGRYLQAYNPHLNSWVLERP